MYIQESVRLKNIKTVMLEFISRKIYVSIYYHVNGVLPIGLVE